MKPQLFGVNSHGVFSVDRDTGEVQLIFSCHVYQDILNKQCVGVYMF